MRMSNVKKWQTAPKEKHQFKDETFTSAFKITLFKQICAEGKNGGRTTVQTPEDKTQTSPQMSVALWFGDAACKQASRQSTSDHLVIRKLWLIWTAEVKLRSVTQRQPLRRFAMIVGKEINISICLRNLFPHEGRCNGFIMMPAVSLHYQKIT